MEWIDSDSGRIPILSWCSDVQKTAMDQAVHKNVATSVIDVKPVMSSSRMQLVVQSALLPSRKSF